MMVRGTPLSPTEQWQKHWVQQRLGQVVATALAVQRQPEWGRC